MEQVWTHTLVSVGAVSLVSLLGAVILARHDTHEGPMRFLIAIAIGALLGDVVIHLLPEAYEELGVFAAWWLLGGFMVFFVLEKLLHWRHEHGSSGEEMKPEPYGVMNLVADGLHNFIDGALVAASYLISFPIGLATTVAVFLHEVPQELGDYAILRTAGFSRGRALFWNFVSALLAIVGALAVLLSGIDVEISAQRILAFTAGGFVYIIVLLAHKLGDEIPFPKLVTHLIGVGAGVLLMWLITFIE